MRATTQQFTTLQEFTKSLEARIQQQIDSNAAMAQTFRAQNVLPLFETQQKTTAELDDVSRRLAGVEREADDYRRVMEIMVSLENVQEDFKALREDVNQLLGTTSATIVPLAQQVAETIFELSEEPVVHVSTSQTSHYPMPTDPVTPRIVSEPIGLPTPIANPLIPESSPPDHPMGSVSPSP